MFDQAAVLHWLDSLHGGAPGLVHVCATDAWHGATFATDRASLTDAAAYVAKLDAEGREGIYARVTTLRAPLTGRRRGGASDTLAIPALWADIDIAGPGHEATPLPLPMSVDAAGDVVEHSGLPKPTLWVHSGGGMYPYWMLDVPHVIADADDLADVAELSTIWQRILGDSAQRLGWHYGTGVGDLSRVLRIPGTVNRKAGRSRRCRILDGAGPRYTLEELYAAAADAISASEPRDAAGPPSSTLLMPTHDRSALGGTSPGDDYAARTTWADILAPHGWTLAFERSGVQYWRRPGKRGPGVSATTNALGTDRLRVFTTSTVFEATSYSKLGALAVLDYGGDIPRAAKGLRDLGYGDPPAASHVEAAHYADGLIVPRGSNGTDDADATCDTRAVDPSALDDEALALAARQRYAADVAAEARRIRVVREARRTVEAEEFESTFREPPSTFALTDELALPDEPLTWRIDSVLPSGANAMLVAQYKAGKTTLCNDLVRALADGEPFLGRFEVDPPEGRVAIFNYEVGEAQYRAWLRDVGIVNTDKVCVLNLRGYRLPVTMPHVESWMVEWLAARKVTTWIVDPFARAFGGSGDENSNADVSTFVESLDVIKERAGVRELILPVHTGRAEQEAGQERARGATRLDDWADVRWLLTLDDQRRRYFRASGRDVEVDEESLAFDAATRRLTLGGWDRQGMKRRDLVGDVVDFVREHPGLGVNEIVSGVSKAKARVVAALHDAISHRLVYVREIGNRKRLHYVAGHTGPLESGE